MSTSTPQVHPFVATADTLLRALSGSRDRTTPGEEPVFVRTWLDFTDIYGMAYVLTDGTAGVQFNDATNIVVWPEKMSVKFLPFLSSSKSTLGRSTIILPITTSKRSYSRGKYIGSQKYRRNYFSSLRLCSVFNLSLISRMLKREIHKK
jgi:hypothetical protein